ncbi:MAG: methyl-accepting chemotaxis protein [Candidatus Omnitrophica bacterium]|nr:methyl-accepting chemotaxis protein [Candidatus Omnitrophota bacterium]
MGITTNFFSSLKVKLVVIFLLLSLVPVAAVSLVSLNAARSTLKNEIFEKLSAQNQMRKARVLARIDEKEKDLDMFSQTQDIVEAVAALTNYYKASGGTAEGVFKIKTPEYQTLSESVDPMFSKYIKEYGYADIYLIGAEHGHIMYSAARGPELGTNLGTSELAGSGLAKVWRGVVGKKGFVIVDYSFFGQVKDPVIFAGVPVKDPDGAVKAVLAIRLGVNELSQIFSDKTGMGETGESYLVGEDRLMRSDSRFEANTILKKKVDTVSVLKVFRDGHNDGVGIIKDYRGKDVLSAYGHVGINEKFGTGFEWAIISEIDLSEAMKPVNDLIRKVLLLALLIAFIVVVAALVIAAKITGPIEEIARVSQKIGSGDLTGSVVGKTSDEIGVLAGSFNQMSGNVRGMIKRIQEAVNQLTSASNEILAATEQQAAGAREQSSAIAETTSAAHELLVSSEQVGNTIRQVSQAAMHALNGMTKIRDLITKTGGMITLLGEKSREIGKITGLIDDIADQTNLLAVNASIEAARAGDEGRGFSVVADEIRKLSDSTARSTKDITALIEIIQHEMTNVVISMEKSASSVEEEMTLAKDTSEKAKEITMSANQQIAGSKQIAEAMGSIDEVMKQIASGTVQTQASVEQMTKLAKDLEKIIAGFKIA